VRPDFVKVGTRETRALSSVFCLKFNAIIRYKRARKEVGLLDTGFFIASGNGTVMHENTLLLTAVFIDCEVGLGVPG
jgi:hypothetical protein